MLSSVIFVKYLVDHLKQMCFLSIQSEHLKHLKIDQLILSSQLIHLRDIHMLGTSLPQCIIWHIGYNFLLSRTTPLIM